MNVYLTEVARRLAERDIEVEVFTRASSSDLPPVVELTPGVLVRHVPAGPYGPLPKHELAAQLCTFAFGVLRTEASQRLGHYDIVHSHYWLSGQVGRLAKERWQVPLVHSMHTLAKVKNATLARGDTPEPREREVGESRVIAAADQLVANTSEEARELITLYGAERARVATVPPGVDLGVFHPDAEEAGQSRQSQAAARARLGLPPGGDVLLFVGRVQPLKAPDVALRAVERLVRDDPQLRERLTLAVVGGPSGSGTAEPDQLRRLAAELGIDDVVRFEPPCGQERLADWYRAATATVVPSRSESFGLVAVESQACGTPVVAAAVGGLRTAVHDGVSGVLVDGHAPGAYARALRRVLARPAWRQRLAAGARRHATNFGWQATVDGLLEVYTGAMTDVTTPLPVAVNQ